MIEHLAIVATVRSTCTPKALPANPCTAWPSGVPTYTDTWLPPDPPDSEAARRQGLVIQCPRRYTNRVLP